MRWRPRREDSRLMSSPRRATLHDVEVNRSLEKGGPAQTTLAKSQLRHSLWEVHQSVTAREGRAALSIGCWVSPRNGAAPARATFASDACRNTWEAFLLQGLPSGRTKYLMRSKQ